MKSAMDCGSLLKIFLKLQNHCKKAFKKCRLHEIFLYLVLVMEDHRDAYLFDGCVATCENVVGLVKCFSESYQISFERFPFRLVTIALGKSHDDFVVIRSDTLQRKLLNIFSPVWIEAPLVVDVNGSHPRFCTTEENLSIKLSLQNTFKNLVWSSETYFPVVSDYEFEELVGFPFVAGWLLGYPCVYRSSNPQKCLASLSDDFTSPTANALSMTCLKKISVNAILDQRLSFQLGYPRKFPYRSVSNHLCGGMKDEQGDRVKIDLFHFTAPSDLIGDDTFLSEWLQRRLMKYEDFNSGRMADKEDFSLVRSCDIAAAEITLSSVML